jgi:hypothetical protein
MAGGDASVALLKVGANRNVNTETATGQVDAAVLTNTGLMAGVTLDGTKVSRLKTLQSATENTKRHCSTFTERAAATVMAASAVSFQKPASGNQHRARPMVLFVFAFDLGIAFAKRRIGRHQQGGILFEQRCIERVERVEQQLSIRLASAVAFGHGFAFLLQAFDELRRASAVEDLIKHQLLDVTREAGQRHVSRLSRDACRVCIVFCHGSSPNEHTHYRAQ